jgi:hypothetical protein
LKVTISVTLVTGRSCPEICGTGEQGGSVDGLGLLVGYVTISERFLWLPLGLQPLRRTPNRESNTLYCDYRDYLESSYLVDPASSHMLVSKIKPCMSKYKQLCTVKLRMAH